MNPAGRLRLTLGKRKDELNEQKMNPEKVQFIRFGNFPENFPH